MIQSNTIILIKVHLFHNIFKTFNRGADLAALVEEASLAAIRELMTSNELSTDNCVHKRHFDTALTKVRPSVSEKVCTK